MTSQKKDEDIQCEYVYDQEKSVSQHYANILSEECSEGDSDKDDSEPPVESNASKSKHSETSKKKRTSRYDENFYALPDNDDDDDSEISSLQSKLKTKESQLASKEIQLAIWRVTTIISVFILLVSAAGIVYLTIEKN